MNLDCPPQTVGVDRLQTVGRLLAAAGRQLLTAGHLIGSLVLEVETLILNCSQSEL